MRPEGDGPAVELGIEPGDDPAEVRPSTARKPPQDVLQGIPGHQRVTAVAADLRIRQHAPRSPQMPPALRQGSAHGTRPQPLFFHPPDRCASRRRHTVDPADRYTSPGPPALRAQPLRTPTRHRPFGSSCGHPATGRSVPHGARRDGAGRIRTGVLPHAVKARQPLRYEPRPVRDRTRPPSFSACEYSITEPRRPPCRSGSAPSDRPSLPASPPA